MVPPSGRASVIICVMSPGHILVSIPEFMHGLMIDDIIPQLLYGNFDVLPFSITVDIGLKLSMGACDFPSLSSYSMTLQYLILPWNTSSIVESSDFSMGAGTMGAWGVVSCGCIGLLL